jgi:hypothetical protein
MNCIQLAIIRNGKDQTVCTIFHRNSEYSVIQCEYDDSISSYDPNKLDRLNYERSKTLSLTDSKNLENHLYDLMKCLIIDNNSEKFTYDLLIYKENNKVEFNVVHTFNGIEHLQSHINKFVQIV